MTKTLFIKIGSALELLADKTKPQAAAEMAKGLVVALHKPAFRSIIVIRLLRKALDISDLHQ